MALSTPFCRYCGRTFRTRSILYYFQSLNRQLPINSPTARSAPASSSSRVLPQSPYPVPSSSPSPLWNASSGLVMNGWRSNRKLATLVARPVPEALEELDDIPEVIQKADEKELGIEITESAARQLHRISAREKNPGLALRISVESGGCHGYQYKMELVDIRPGHEEEGGKEDTDFLFSAPPPSSSQPSQTQESSAYVVIDPLSLSLIKGSRLDFETELIGSSFRIYDNPQAKGAGCGCGISWEPNI